MSQKAKPSAASSLFSMVLIAGLVIVFTRSHGDLWTPLLAVVGLVLFPYLLGPILIHRTQNIRLGRGFEQVDPLGPDFPEVAAQHAGEIESQMELLGFSIEGYYRLVASAPRTAAFVSLFQNLATGEVSKSGWILILSDKPTLATSYLSFTTHFSDGTVVSTSNVTTVRAFPRMPPPSYGYTLPEIRQALSLHSAHKAIVGRFDGGRLRVDLIKDDPLGYLIEREVNRPYANIVEQGYYYRDDEAMLLRPTWKGAILMTWKLCWPAKQIGLALRRAHGRKLLRELEAGTWTP